MISKILFCGVFFGKWVWSHDLLGKISSFYYNFIFLLRGVIKNYLVAFCPHIDYMSLQNLESVYLMVSEKHCLDMIDRQTDGWMDGWRKIVFWQ